jgi:hypothetical protein
MRVLAMGLLYILGAFFLFIAFGAARSAIRLRRLWDERKGKGFDRAHFVGDFEGSNVPLEIPGVVFDYYSSKRGWRDFPFAANDKYWAVLYDDAEDIEDDARALVGRLRMIFPPSYILRREWGDKPVETLRDMVIWLDLVRQHQAS